MELGPSCIGGSLTGRHSSVSFLVHDMLPIISLAVFDGRSFYYL